MLSLATSYFDLFYLWYDACSQQIKRIQIGHIGHVEDCLINTHLSQAPEEINGCIRRKRIIASVSGKMDRIQGGLFNIRVGTVESLAMILQDIEFALQFIFAKPGEEIAGVAILSHQAQRFLLATASNQDRRVWLLH